MSSRRLLHNIAVTASLAVAATTLGSAVRFLRADEPQAAVAAFDKTLLEIPDGETTEFYQKRLEVLRTEFRARPELKTFPEGVFYRPLSPEQNELTPALANVSLKLAYDASLSSAQREKYFLETLEILTVASDLDVLRACLAQAQTICEASPNDENALRARRLEQTLFMRRLFAVLQTSAQRQEEADLPRCDRPSLTPNEEAELRSLGTEIVAKVNSPETLSQSPRVVQNWATAADNVLDFVARLAPEIAVPLQKELRDILSNSDDKNIRKIVERLNVEIRRDELKGTELKLEGLLADGTEFDWNSFRGKVVWIVARKGTVYWNTFTEPRYQELYAQFADAGLAVLYYDSFTPNPYRSPDGKEKETGFPVFSRALTQDANKGYADFAALYGFQSVGQAILVDVDGKVVDVRPTVDVLEKLLKERFPDVK